jgi:hypothetical protein
MRDEEREAFRRSALEGSDGYEFEMDEPLFRRSVEIAKLAVELARSKRKPLECIEEAAILVNEASKVVAFHYKKRADEIAERFSGIGPRIPLKRLSGEDAEEMVVGDLRMKPYKSDDHKGLKDALTKWLGTSEMATERLEEWQANDIPRYEWILFAEYRMAAEKTRGKGRKGEGDGGAAAG